MRSMICDSPTTYGQQVNTDSVYMERQDPCNATYGHIRIKNPMDSISGNVYRKNLNCYSIG